MIRYFFVTLTLLISGIPLFGQNSISELRFLLENQKYKAALNIVGDVITANPKDPQAYYLAGILNLDVDNQEAAKNYFSQGIRIRNKYALNHVGMGRVLQKMGKTAEAQTVFEKAIEYNEKERNAEVYVELGLAYLERGKEYYKDAESFLLRAQSKAPKNPKTYIALGDYYFAKGISALALFQYEKAIETDPNYIQGYLRVAKLKIQDEAFNDGLDYLNRAIALKPDFAPAYKERGELYSRAKQYDLARDNYKKYVELTGSDLQAQIRYASFLFLSEDYNEAINVINTALKDTVTNVLLRLQGYAYTETGNTEKGLEFMDRYFERADSASRIADDYETYGTVMRKLGRLSAAEQNYLLAYKMDSTRTKDVERVAEMYEKDQNWTKAVQYREMHLNTKPQKKYKDWLNLGLAYYQNGQLNKADSSFNEVINLDPKYYVGYYWKAATQVKLERQTSTFGAAVAPYQRMAELLEADMEADGDLKKKETSRLVTAYEYIAYYYFNPTGVEGDYHCEEARPYINRVMELDPQSVNIKNLADYCQ